MAIRVMRDTILEPVVPFTPTLPVKLDAWRWRDVPTFDEYRTRVLRAEAERTQRRMS